MTDTQHAPPPLDLNAMREAAEAWDRGNDLAGKLFMADALRLLAEMGRCRSVFTYILAHETVCPELVAEIRSLLPATASQEVKP